MADDKPEKPKDSSDPIDDVSYSPPLLERSVWATLLTSTAQIQPRFEFQKIEIPTINLPKIDFDHVFRTMEEVIEQLSARFIHKFSVIRPFIFRDCRDCGEKGGVRQQGIIDSQERVYLNYGKRTPSDHIPSPRSVDRASDENSTRGLLNYGRRGASFTFWNAKPRNCRNP
jgi:hypothetical protein